MISEESCDTEDRVAVAAENSGLPSQEYLTLKMF